MALRLLTALLLILAPAAILLPLDALVGQGESAPKPVPDRVCARCHRDVSLTSISHRFLAVLHPDAACEACHGSAAAHVADPTEVTLAKHLDAAGKAALCLACHRGYPEHAATWEKTDFAKKGQTCADCHKVHEASDARPAYPGDARGYLGDGACRPCHGADFAAFAKSFHGAVIDRPGAGCEACHGAGSAHAKAAPDFAAGKAPPAIAKDPPAASCLLCHRAIPDRHAREMPVYAAGRPACTVCHDVHVDRADPLWSAAEVPAALAGQRAGDAACANCHRAAVDSAAASVHGPLLTEGAGGCEVCHGPALAHAKSGGRSAFVLDPLARTPAEASGLCLTCHTSTPDHAKGWAGGPLEAQGLSCLTCHEAHGGKESQGRPILASGAAPVEGKNVGSATCAICHADPHPGIAKSVHGILLADPKAAGCESCHGPGSAHVMRAGAKDAIRNPARLPKEQQAGFCLSCHRSDSSLFAYSRGDHARAGLSCTTCHDPLVSEAESPRKKGVDLCTACHGDARAKFNLPNHHPLGEAGLDCSSCHAPHGDPPGILALEIRKDRCAECHVDKRGPFLFEHEADRQDGCVICHVPHGSINRRLLTHRDVRTLCIQCHVTPVNHDQSAGSPFRNCLSCHGSIHGSHVDANFLR
ncbi:MAG: DmsE family decaheme c-type cytochrome [Planctomycetes bacterium]|jgi:DmsE family decaheme c-type cytochrome|nr:DmsE family decaheme c-type cytochrome [Planctomycetota bacterium]